MCSPATNRRFSVLDDSRIGSLAWQHGNIAEDHSVQFHLYSRLMGQDISELNRHLDDHARVLSITAQVERNSDCLQNGRNSKNR
jgi:hypothetical protein